MGNPRVVVAGSVVIDHDNVDGKAYVRAGSPAMFMAAYLNAHHGLVPTVIASYGPDFLPYTTGISMLPEEPNLARTVEFNNIVSAGRRTQYCRSGQAELPPLGPGARDALSNAEIVVFAPLTPYFPSSFVRELMAPVGPGALKVLLPQGYLRSISAEHLVEPRDFDEAGEIVPLFDIIVISDEDHPAAAGRAQDWQKLSPRTAVVVTENARGADIVAEGRTAHVPTVPVPAAEVVDPIGLGDVFSAALACDYYVSRDLVAAVRAGNRAARESLLGLN